MSDHYLEVYAPNIVIVDLDGTLADITHRRHHVSKKPKDWKSFFSKMSEDTPRPGLSRIINMLHSQCVVVIFSARSYSHRHVTTEWLKKHGIQHSLLYMREDEGQMSDVEVKRRMLADLRNTFPKGRILGVFDDRQRVVDMWRAEGLECYQVDKWEEAE